MLRRRAVAVAGLAALAAAGAACGSRCRDIAARQQALARRAPAAGGPHLQLRLPFRRADELIAESLRQEPLAAAIEVPELPGIGRFLRGRLDASVREVRLLPAGPDRVRFAIKLDVTHDAEPLTGLEVDAEVAPVVVREAGSVAIVIGFGPRNLLRVRPRLAPDAGRALANAIERSLPASLRRRVPRALLDEAAGPLAEHLAGAAFDGLRALLLPRLGEMTRLRIRLPDVPIARVSLRSAATAARDPASPHALELDIATDLPVRRGLSRRRTIAGDEIELRISGSASAELANWAIDRGHLPQRYTRSLAPDPQGQFRPHLDYIAGLPVRPFKIHVFQERGGCSYFLVGLRPEVAMRGGKLEVAALDHRIEEVDGPAHIQLAVWLKQLLVRSVDRTRRLAAETRFEIGRRAFTTRAVGARFDGDELAFQLRVTRSSRARSNSVRARLALSVSHFVSFASSRFIL
jgi:hypothetical protein